MYAPPRGQNAFYAISTRLIASLAPESLREFGAAAPIARRAAWSALVSAHAAPPSLTTHVGRDLTVSRGGWHMNCASYRLPLADAHSTRHSDRSSGLWMKLHVVYTLKLPVSLTSS